MLQEFKAFAFKGNLIDVAVAFILGAAFNSLVSTTVASLLTPLIAAIGGEPSFGALAFTVNESRFAYGTFLNSLISFLITAWVLFVLVKAVTRIGGLDEQKIAALAHCDFCRETVAADATRCPHCTSHLTPAPA